MLSIGLNCGLTAPWQDPENTKGAHNAPRWDFTSRPLRDRTLRLAIINDYQNLAGGCGDWHGLAADVSVDIFNDRLVDGATAAERLAPYEIVVAAREETRFDEGLVGALPNLELLVTHGMSNAALDLAALAAHGVTVCGTTYGPTQSTTAEITWTLILALAKHVTAEDRTIRDGGWGADLPVGLSCRTLGLLGLGQIGERVARTGQTFDMEIIAWSENLTGERCTDVGVRLVDKAALFRQSDFLSVHLKLGDRTRGLVGREDIGLMKPDSCLVNTSRGPIVDEAALVDALENRRIGGAGLDVYDVEPLPQNHRLRRLANTVVVAHIGGRTRDNFVARYGEAFEDVAAWLAGKPVRVLVSPPVS